MPSPKGHTNNPNGRPKGSVNKSNAAVKEALAIYIAQNVHKLNGWLDEIYREHGALAAHKSFVDTLEYNVAKLARSEHTGKDGGAIEHAVIAEVVYKGIDE